MMHIVLLEEHRDQLVPCIIGGAFEITEIREYNAYTSPYRFLTTMWFNSIRVYQ